MGTRDDFPEKTKRALALRANHICSFNGCPQPTSGPSDEAPGSVAQIGEAAHIHGAASGPGSRRYLASMTREERKHISNAIWLCATHAKLIDRNEVTYTADVLREMKSRHEAWCAARLAQAPAAGGDDSDLIAIGPGIVCVGTLRSMDDKAWTLHVRSFVEGDFHALTTFIETFEQNEAINRYILVNELGDGRLLRASPAVTKSPDGGYTLRCDIIPAAARISATEIPASWVLTENHDLATNGGNWATVAGLDALPQHVKCCLSHQLGESPAYPTHGARFAEFYRLLQGSGWFDRYLKLEAIRQAAIPFWNPIGKREATQLLCVEQVVSVEAMAKAPKDDWLLIRVDFRVKGVGRWQHDLSICVPSDPPLRHSWTAFASGPTDLGEVVAIPFDGPLLGPKIR